MKLDMKLDDNYEIVVTDEADLIKNETNGVTVYGCDCQDTLTDRKKIEELRDALTEYLKSTAGE